MSETGIKTESESVAASTTSWILKDLEKNPPPDPLPTGWIMRKSRAQQFMVYYYNQETGESRWDKPKKLVSAPAPVKKELAAAAIRKPLIKQETPTPSQNKRQASPKKRSSPAAASAPIKMEPSRKKPKGPKEVRVFHILKKHKDSRRPASWRNPKITCTVEEAREELGGLVEVLSEASSGEELRATFEELARTESDCSSAKRGGDLGFFGRKKMQPQFESASFGLDIGELSGIVETSSGVHVILRIG